jgi:hypothetical protein
MRTVKKGAGALLSTARPWAPAWSTCAGRHQKTQKGQFGGSLHELRGTRIIHRTENLETIGENVARSLALEGSVSGVQLA